MIRLATLLLLLAAPVQSACRQALALGLDVSGSVDAQEYRLQMDGLASALERADVMAALLSMPEAPVELAVFEWSGPDDQHIVLDWTVMADAGSVHAVAGSLRASARVRGDVSTAIGAAMRFGAGLLAERPACWKATLDLSGEGRSNTGPHPRDIRATLPGDILVNGLTIGNDTTARGDDTGAEISGLSSYYRAYVIFGEGAFVETALGFPDFEAAMARKLLRELQVIVIGSR